MEKEEIKKQLSNIIEGIEGDTYTADRLIDLVKKI